MKYFAALLLVAVLVIFTPSAHAQEDKEQEFDFQRAYQDYVFTLNTYTGLHSEYALAKAQYQQAGTLVAQTRAREATAKMLEARDQVVITFITALRLRLMEAEGVSEIVKNGLFGKIDAEVAWFQDHKARISSAGSLQDLARDSKQAADRFELTERVAYEVLATVPMGRIGLMRNSTNALLEDINSKVFSIRSEGVIDTVTVERWSLEIENKITRSLDKEIEARGRIPELTGELRGRSSSRRTIFNDIIFKLEESRQFLRDATRFMREIVREITTT